ncbi:MULTISPECIES: TonB-dependent siderophore receptor [Pseudomonas]|uniref:Metal-pseudopaline receptor CntO n=1 Tax=Pseudomonas soli TaxID=1306993 RepID=A0A2V4IFE0_9PSED|nr:MULTISPECIES: TonB-dependent siderophore receptor [Pseudomonas]PYB76756.1 TonB-dependent siderophore receptor [Pseudomonas soli]PZW86270.1 iron complex outermembrane receptor protein [Pseudomonas sp. 2848]QWA29281.1 TonB-dependent siderophore receptor [Pseudomonas sp. RC3H12]
MSNLVFRPSVLALAIALGSSGLIASLQAAESVNSLYSYDIAPGPLGDTLARIAREGGQVLSADPALVRGHLAPAIRGQMSSREAAEQALLGSGLVLSITPGGAWSLQPSSSGNSLELAPTQVDGRGAESAWGPVEGYVAKRTGTATKSDTSVLEVPQTVNIVTAQQITAQGAQSVTEALRYTPGITGGGFPDRVGLFDEVTSRGFLPAPLYLDGLHLPYGNGSTGGAMQIDPYTLERIEVLKGPASVLYGQNQPGGIINMVSKRPTATPVHEIVFGGGSQDRRYGAFDFGGPLDPQGQWLYRLTGTVTDKNGEIDYVEQKRYMLAPSLTWMPNEQLTLTLYGHFQKDNDVPEAQGLPAAGTVFNTPNGRIKRSTFIGEPGLNSYDRDQYSLGYEVSYVLNDIWTLRQNTRYAAVDDRYVAPLHGYRFVTNPRTGADDQRYMTRFGVDWAQNNKVLGIDNIAQARFATGDVQHTVLIGVDRYHSNSKFLGRYDYNAPAIDLYDPVYGQRPNYVNPNRWDNTVDQTGLYVQDQLDWGRWFLTVGGRYDWAKTDNRQPLAGTRSGSRDEQFSGRAGLGYKFDNGVTPYVSYAESFQPLSGTDAEGKPFEPSTGKQYETGIKYQPVGQESFVQLSVYQIDQQNALTSNPGNPTYSNQSGALRSRGVELEGKLNVASDLNVIASVARNQVKFTKDNDGREGRHMAGTSPLTASLWVDYQVRGDTPWRGVGAGIGARYVRGSDGTDIAEEHFVTPSYTVFDGMLSYDFGESPLQVRGLKLKLNMHNLEDRKYISSCTTELDCYYGEGRTMTTDLTYNW